MMTKAVLFDLDNTLYDAQQYFLGAFNGISKYVSSNYNVSESKVYQILVDLWREKTSMYPHLFDDLLSHLHLNQDSPEAIVKIFNEYNGKIDPYPDVIPTLGALQERAYRLGIITDGNVERQKRKIESLALKPLFDAIIYAKEVGSKPSSAPFLMALERLNVKASEAFYIADNPLLDFKGAKEVGINTVRILRGEFVGIPGDEAIDFEIEKLDEFLEIVGARV